MFTHLNRPELLLAAASFDWPNRTNIVSYRDRTFKRLIFPQDTYTIQFQLGLGLGLGLGFYFGYISLIHFLSISTTSTYQLHIPMVKRASKLRALPLNHVKCAIIP